MAVSATSSAAWRVVERAAAAAGSATCSVASPEQPAANRPARAGGMGGLLGALLPVLGGMLAGGGLQKVLSGFEANGLAAQADSWVATGDNAPISGADVRKVVGDEELAQIAAQLGVSEDEAADAVAQVLPTVVDQVSPDGQLAPDDELDTAFSKLENLGEPKA